ncbi:uncharacterized protein SPSK_10020 [Sporothrix schenckii 1099-18]|uniref:Uncharacterized protein n=2 Tax=Sporothrix schenckii TaxID=29908 RepID=U7PY96_SPOS1|nr:uncharacterized protein SPSK_10020 [Sporothrix schenckii 1099-18]ERT00573.1 hypothetical protein HMPREF1624_03947 [Sporothrix schenckii ATCC 58251]KJR84912.1 hypothetical protein SPSK_10020 [Sporothrix schenckii 1099-18]
MEKFTVLAGYSTVLNARKRFGEVKKRVRSIVFSPDPSKDDAHKSECAVGESGDNLTTMPMKGPKKTAKSGTKRKGAGITGTGGPAAKKGKVGAKKHSGGTGALGIAQDPVLASDEGVKGRSLKQEASNDDRV